MLKRIPVWRKLFPLNCLGPDVIFPKVESMPCMALNVKACLRVALKEKEVKCPNLLTEKFFSAH